MQWVRKRRPAAVAVAGAGRAESRRVRLVVFVALAGLLSGLVVAVAPSPASAGRIVPCPAGMTDWRWVSAYGRAHYRYEGYRMTMVAATERFAVSDIQILDNTGSNLQTEYTVTSERTQTHTVSVTVGVEASGSGVLSFLKSNVSVNVVQTISTKLGVTFKQTIPPHTRFTAEYGTTVFDVTYYIEAWRYIKPIREDGTPPVGGECEEWGFYPQTTVAPTMAETWRLSTS